MKIREWLCNDGMILQKKPLGKISHYRQKLIHEAELTLEKGTFQS